MRILDEQDNELKTKDVDGKIGYLELEKLLVEHHEAIKGVPLKQHYKVKSFDFSDGTSLKINKEDDPHIKVIDAENGLFEYIPLSQEEDKEVAGIDLEIIIDQNEIFPHDAWDEYEYIQRYKLYTENELEQIRLKELEDCRKEKFLLNGEKQIEELQKQINSLSDKIDGIIETLEKEGK